MRLNKFPLETGEVLVTVPKKITILHHFPSSYMILELPWALNDTPFTLMMIQKEALLGNGTTLMVVKPLRLALNPLKNFLARGHLALLEYYLQLMAFNY
ncbi:MAG: hypothetical protein CM15mP52_1250 [Candidatus Neomarinimicrobiota bacterium]|nr:MAG: hypothetical protein CM15mP52_1250 [Candidatus Neomarinimicrobiota bacterium]